MLLHSPFWCIAWLTSGRHFTNFPYLHREIYHYPINVNYNGNEANPIVKTHDKTHENIYINGLVVFHTIKSHDGFDLKPIVSS